MLVLVAATEAHAVAERCGTDDFGNTVCIDKDGVVTTAPQPGQAGGSADANATGKSSSIESERDDEKSERSRCGIDPFGNKVCR